MHGIIIFIRILTHTHTQKRISNYKHNNICTYDSGEKFNDRLTDETFNCEFKSLLATLIWVFSDENSASESVVYSLPKALLSGWKHKKYVYKKLAIHPSKLWWQNMYYYATSEKYKLLDIK